MELPRQKEEGEEEKRRKPTSYLLFLKTDDQAKACALIPLDIQEGAVVKRKLEEFKRQIDADSLEVSELLSLQGYSVLPMAIRKTLLWRLGGTEGRRF